MPTDAQTLRTIELFKDLPSEDMETLANALHPMRVSEGEVLTRRNDPAHTFYVVLSGNYMIYFKEGRAFTLHEKGDIIGMATVITPFQYRGTTVALTDGEVLSMAGSTFLELVQLNSALGEKLMRAINGVIAHRSAFTDELKDAVVATGDAAGTAESDEPDSAAAEP